MIYDHIDMGTKYYLVANVRDWANLGDNALVLLQNPKVKELTESDLSWNSTDDIVWTIMYLIGVGLLRYVITDDGQVFALGLNLNWRQPPWLFEPESKKKLNRHIEILMEIEQVGRLHGMPPTASAASLDVNKYGKIRNAPPREPVMNDLNHERMVIARNERMLRKKRAFHRGGH